MVQAGRDTNGAGPDLATAPMQRTSTQHVEEQTLHLLREVLARPTAEVNGIGGGYRGKGIKTAIPSRAMAKLTFRLVPNQEPERILALVKEHLRKNLPLGVEPEMEPGHTGPCYLADPHSPNSDAAQRCLREVFGGDVAFIRGGGSIPILSAFRDLLGAETLLLGLVCQIPASMLPTRTSRWIILRLAFG